MSKQSLLIVDADQRSLRVVEVTLRNAGHDVISCSSATAALATLKTIKPDILLTDTRLSDLDGFELVRRIRSDRSFDDMSIIFLSSDATIESKVRGLEIGADDYFTKPVYIREVVDRVNQEAERHGERGIVQGGETRMRMRGSLDEFSFPEIVQTLGVSQKSGVIYLVGPKKLCGVVYFDRGKIVDARVGDVHGQEAAYRMMQWTQGHFDVEFRPIRSNTRTIDQSNESLILEGARQIDERAKLAERLPTLDTVVCIDAVQLANQRARLTELELELAGAAKSKLTVAQLLMLPNYNEYDLLCALVNLVELGVMVEQIRTKAADASGVVAVIGARTNGHVAAQIDGALALASEDEEMIIQLTERQGKRQDSGIIRAESNDRFELALKPPPLPQVSEFRVGTAGNYLLVEADLEASERAKAAPALKEEWDATLSELALDPGICSAVEEIKASVPPGAGVRASAPTDDIDAAIARGERVSTGIDELEVALEPYRGQDYDDVRESRRVPKRNALVHIADRIIQRISSRR